LPAVKTVRPGAADVQRFRSSENRLPESKTMRLWLFHDARNTHGAQSLTDRECLVEVRKSIAP
jgi:hypothetical protein